MRYLLIVTVAFLVSIIEVSAKTATVNAVQNCEAYQSFRKKTNPGKIRLITGQAYPVKEQSNKSDHTKYRIVVKGAQPELRWVDGRCVQPAQQVQPILQKTPKKQVKYAANNSQTVGRCTRESGLADSNILALSWQSAFCETKRDKAECKITDPRSFQANNFTLHGLWPNRDSCNRQTGYYGYCGASNTKAKHFCDYPPLNLTGETRARLNINMPSAAHGTCLQRHEWYKHGTCQNAMDVNQYYDYALELQSEFNASGLAKLMTDNMGKTVASAEFFKVFDAAFGTGAHQKLQLKCRRGDLIDVYVNLPKVLDEHASLKTLLASAKANFSNGCGAKFKVDAIDD